MLDPARLVFIDETATSTNMVRLRGRCPRGERLVASVPLPFFLALAHSFAAAGCPNYGLAASSPRQGMNELEFMTSDGEVLAISIPRTEAHVIRYSSPFGNRHRVEWPVSAPSDNITRCSKAPAVPEPRPGLLFARRATIGPTHLAGRCDHPRPAVRQRRVGGF